MKIRMFTFTGDHAVTWARARTDLFLRGLGRHLGDDVAHFEDQPTVHRFTSFIEEVTRRPRTGTLPQQLKGHR